MEALKAQSQVLYLDSKMKFDEEVMNHKETIYKLKVALAGVEERNLVLKDQLTEREKRI